MKMIVKGHIICLEVVVTSEIILHSTRLRSTQFAVF